MRRVYIGVQEPDGQRLNTPVNQLVHRLAHPVLVEFRQDAAVGAHAFRDTDRIRGVSGRVWLLEGHPAVERPRRPGAGEQEDLLVALRRQQADARPGVRKDHVRYHGRAVEDQLQVREPYADLLADRLHTLDHATRRIVGRGENLALGQLSRPFVKDQHVRKSPTDINRNVVHGRSLRSLCISACQFSSGWRGGLSSALPSADCLSGHVMPVALLRLGGAVVPVTRDLTRNCLLCGLVPEALCRVAVRARLLLR